MPDRSVHRGDVHAHFVPPKLHTPESVGASRRLKVTLRLSLFLRTRTKFFVLEGWGRDG